MIENVITDKETGDVLASVITSMYIRNIGGPIVNGTYKNIIPKRPASEPPLKVHEVKTTIEDS